MCLSCGCKQPNEKHGNDANITMNDIEAAAKAGEVSTQEAAQNISEGVRQFGGQMATAGTGQKTGNNEQSFEKRQGGYGAGSSSGPQ